MLGDIFCGLNAAIYNRVNFVRASVRFGAQSVPSLPEFMRFTSCDPAEGRLFRRAAMGSSSVLLDRVTAPHEIISTTLCDAIILLLKGFSNGTRMSGNAD